MSKPATASAVPVRRAVSRWGDLRISSDNLGEYKTLFTGNDRQLRIVARVVHPDAIKRRRNRVAAYIRRYRVIRVRLHEQHRNAILGARAHDGVIRQRVTVIRQLLKQTALTPADDQAAGAIEYRVQLWEGPRLLFEEVREETSLAVTPVMERSLRGVTTAELQVRAIGADGEQLGDAQRQTFGAAGE